MPRDTEVKVHLGSGKASGFCAWARTGEESTEWKWERDVKARQMGTPALCWAASSQFSSAVRKLRCPETVQLSSCLPAGLFSRASVKQVLLSPGTLESWGGDLPISSYQGHFTVSIKDATWESWITQGQWWRLIRHAKCYEWAYIVSPSDLVIASAKGLTGSYMGHSTRQVIRRVRKDLKTQGRQAQV